MIVRDLRTHLNKVIIYISECLKSERSLGGPIIRTIEPTNACMMNCVMCPRKHMTRKIEFMDMKLFKSVIDQAKWNRGLDFSHFGDSLMHPQIDKMIAYTNSKGIKAKITVNPNLLSEEMINKLISAKLHTLYISLEGINDKQYKSIRGVNADYGKAVKNVDNLLRIKKNRKSDMNVVITTVIMDKNKNDIPAFRKIWDKEGIEKVQLHGFSTFAGSDEKIFEHASEDIYSKKKGGKFNYCAEPWIGVTVTAAGKVVPCCFDYDEKYVIGDLRKDSLKKIWNSKRMRLLRGQIKNGAVMGNPLCGTCVDGRGINLYETFLAKIGMLKDGII